jgi:hypothetical protein
MKIVERKLTRSCKECNYAITVKEQGEPQDPMSLSRKADELLASHVDMRHQQWYPNVDGNEETLRDSVALGVFASYMGPNTPFDPSSPHFAEKMDDLVRDIVDRIEDLIDDQLEAQAIADRLENLRPETTTPNPRNDYLNGGYPWLKTSPINWVAVREKVLEVTQKDAFKFFKPIGKPKKKP